LKGALNALEQYVRNMDHSGHKPDWADERLASLRKKVAASMVVTGKE